MPQKQLPSFVQTWLENWPTELSALSFKHARLLLSIEEAHALGYKNGIFLHLFNAPAQHDNLLNELEQRLQSLFPTTQDISFARLGSRSAKDTFHAQLTQSRVASASQTIKLLTSGSRRVAQDLRWAIQNDYQPSIFLREWHDIPPENEFRCFMENRRLIAVTQYYYKTNYPVLQNANLVHQIWLNLVTFSQQFAKVCHLDDVVFDVTVDLTHPHRIRLIEINPFDSQTESGLYSWEARDFDGYIRVNNGQEF